MRPHALSFCAVIPGVCEHLHDALDWILERDTKQGETIGGMANIGVALWVAWPWYNPYRGTSEFYKFLTKNFTPELMMALLFTMGLVQWLFLGISHSDKAKSKVVVNAVKVRYAMAFASAVTWYAILKIYYEDGIGGPVVVMAFCLMFMQGWNYLALKRGSKSHRENVTKRFGSQLLSIPLETR